jgi:hypothetical protein
MTYAPDDYALVIGINDYPKWEDGAQSLKGANSDAKEFYDWLLDANGGGLLPGNAHLITSVKDPLSPYQSSIDIAFTQIRDNSEGKNRPSDDDLHRLYLDCQRGRRSTH